MPIASCKLSWMGLYQPEAKLLPDACEVLTDAVLDERDGDCACSSHCELVLKLLTEILDFKLRLKYFRR